MKYIEIYRTDLLNPPEVVTYAHDALTGLSTHRTSVDALPVRDSSPAVANYVGLIRRLILVC
jgi:hypothetical protein